MVLEDRDFAFASSVRGTEAEAATEGSDWSGRRRSCSGTSAEVAVNIAANTAKFTTSSTSRFPPVAEFGEYVQARSTDGNESVTEGEGADGGRGGGRIDDGDER